MALPKRRFSRSRRDKRRLSLHLTLPTLTRCSHCGATIVTHRICPSCGYYRGRQVMKIAEEEKSS
jgi:large subunit ribosomal protein L32